jgi:stage III sporulation protein AC
MDLTLLLQIAGLGLIVAVFCLILSKMDKKDEASMVSIAGIVIALLLIVTEIGGLYEHLQTIFGL